MNILERLKSQFGGKKILVVGLGLQGGGVGVTRFFARLGAIVTVTDLKDEKALSTSLQKLSGLPIRFHLGEHREEDYVRSDFIIKGPSVHWDNEYVCSALDAKIPVLMEASLFAQYCPAPIIGITGTRGKSTTTAMIGELLKYTDKKIHMAGNIHDTSTIELLEIVHPEDIVVLELSSFQLSGFHRMKISPHIAVFTNFYHDHFNYYKTLDDYWHDKCAIFQYQRPEDVLIANETLREAIGKISHQAKTYFVSDTAYSGPLRIGGVHNRRNASVAWQVGKQFNLSESQMTQTLASFSGLPFRQETVRTIGNVSFINDTTSTTPVALSTALEAFSDKHIFLIAGGNGKNLPWEQILHELTNVSHISWIPGTWTDEAYPVIQKQYPKLSSPKYLSLEEAVNDAYIHAKQTGGIVLFSPGATSFATFANEFDRGEQFNTIVDAIKTV